MNETCLDQELEGPVYRGRRERAFPLLQGTQYVIGANRRVPLADDFEHATPDRSQLQAALGADPIGFLQGARHAVSVIMGAARIQVSRQCFHTSAYVIQ